ncbi:hypothetical protein B0J14DRAFT_146440 [Halenospora varia]|nr:hypothetical protein B0J14DRAFT_146440 [Halenospora varia]
MEVFGTVSAAIALALKLEKMAEGLAADLNDAKQFGSTLEKARLQVQLETDRMRDMRILLFGLSDERNVIPGVTFSNFDDRTQLALLNLLRHFSELLALNYKIIDERYGAAEPSASMILNTSISFESFQQASWAKRLRWGFRDKKKLDKLLQELQSWNDRLFARIQISLIRMAVMKNVPTEVSSAPARMATGQTFLDNSPEAGRLGLVNDTKMLQLASSGESGPLTQLRDDGLRNMISKIGSNTGKVSWTTADIGRQMVLLEYKEFLPDLQDNPAVASERRVEQLASMLHSKKSERYHMLSCRGFFVEQQRFVLVFDIPENNRNRSISTLHQDFEQRRKPSLEDRFNMAKTLAASISQLFAVGWVHKSFRSGNILYFTDPIKKQEPQWSNPYILGLEYARPATETSSRTVERHEIEDNIYRHPEQWGMPTTSFSILHDVYALGVVLLEIGLWKQARTISKSGFSKVKSGAPVKEKLESWASDLKLGSAMGRRYQEIVLKCLQGDFGEFRGTAKEQEVEFLERFNTEIVDVLDDIVQTL